MERTCVAADLLKYSEAGAALLPSSTFEVTLSPKPQLLGAERAGPPRLRYPRGVPRAREGLSVDAITLAILAALVVLDSRLSVPDP